MLCVGEDELVVEGRPPASTISLVNALVRTDPVLPLAPQPVLLPPINANEVEIQLIKSSPAAINLVSDVNANLQSCMVFFITTKEGLFYKYCMN